jgi:uncharacterized protein YbjT (DUF2867 family)
MSTAFVAGATGFTGRAVVSTLCEQGHTAVAHVRPDSSQLAHWTEHFGAVGATVDATPWALDAMTQTLARVNPDVVFALLGTTRKRTKTDRKAGADSSYEAVDYGLTVLLMDALRAAELQPRFVYLSAMGAGGKGASAYMAARTKTEAALQESGLPFTIARPSFITGSDRGESRPGERIGAGAVDGLLAVAGVFGGRTLRQRYRSTTNVRLAGALVTLAFDPASENQVALSDALQSG